MRFAAWPILGLAIGFAPCAGQSEVSETRLQVAQDGIALRRQYGKHVMPHTHMQDTGKSGCQLSAVLGFSSPNDDVESYVCE